ncbi:MAG: DUF6442 family protein [Eubacteriales bacterium]|nr:DUF6442 family protein [Eubacteriales bacterium]
MKTMKKEEILAMSRKENRDEREEAVRDQSIRWTFLTMVALSAVFAALRAARGESTMDLAVVVCGSVAVSFLYRFFKTKRRELLLLGVITAGAGIAALIAFCLGR